VEGKARLYQGAYPGLDRYIHSRHCGRFLDRYVRMRLFTDFSDRCVDGGYRGGLVNVNAQAIGVDEVRIRRGDSRAERMRKRALDRMVLRDKAGRRLYVPFDCDRGRCPQYAADVADPRWRAHLKRGVRQAMRHRYRGVFLDDVNWQVNVSDGRERPVAVMDPARWKRAMARLVRGVGSAAGPRREVMVNSVWWRPESSLDDPEVQRGLQGATDYYIERGTEDTRRGQSYEGLLATVDRLHAMGLGVTFENYAALARPAAEFELATYLLYSGGRDAFGATYASCPRTTRSPRRCRTPFWRGYRTDLGRALGPRTLRPDGLLERRFERGMTLVNSPGAPVRGGALDGLFTDLDGNPRVYSLLGGGQGLVLRGPGRPAP
jgi:hypothetical protein